MDHTTKDMQNEIRQTVSELKKERMFLDVLCKDYTSVYFLDLKSDKVEILKLAADANIAEMFQSQRLQQRIYTDEMKRYCSRYVPEPGQEEFLQVMSCDNIRERLKRSDRFIYRYRSVPNKKGYQHFETQIVRITNEGFDNTALLAFRHIDDIVEAELRHQKELEEALEKEKVSNGILRAISKIYYAIFLIDLEKDCYDEISSDSKVYHLTGTHGCASKEMIELCNTFVVPEYQERIRRFFALSTLAQRLEKEETIAEEYLAKDGNWHTARFIVKRRNKGGRAIKVLYVTQLISEEKRKEQNWIAMAEEANRANKAKTDFLRRMSHDIRTPINGILGMIEVADRHRNDVKKLRECREKVLGAVQYLHSLVNNVLDIGKLESGNIVLEYESFDLVNLLKKMYPVIELQASETGINFCGGMEVNQINHRYLMGSPAHLKRILMNLASNAIKYNHKGGIMAICCTELESNADTVTYRFVCSDSGIGMSRQFQKYAFEPFSQEGKDSITTYNGTGLGLSIVKQIVDQMQGKIELKSQEGVGTTITVTVTFDIDHRMQALAEGKCKQPTVDVTGMRALLAEDNELNREIAKMVLEDEGLVVSCAENGAEAMRMFAESKPYEYDFIFMDIMMPVMDGLDATRHIRALQRPDAQDIPILAMTANAFQDDVQMSLKAGINEHLMKPLNVEKIQQAIQKTALIYKAKKEYYITKKNFKANQNTQEVPL